MQNVNSVSLYLLPGMSAKISALDAFVATNGVNHVKDSGEVVKNASLVNGFIVEDDQIGTIEPVEGEPAVIYSHKKYSKNSITFYSNIMVMGRVDIISVPIHDHSSIVTGGPAFGTYFTDDETLDGE